MPAYFTDSSTLVKQYVRERGSAWASLFASFPHDDVHIVAVTPVEIVAALMRRARSGTMTEPDARAACAQFLADLPLDYQVVEVTDTLVAAAIGLAQRHKLRGYDAVQLAAAIEVNHLRLHVGAAPLLFVSADAELNAAARSEGLTVDDLNAHP